MTKFKFDPNSTKNQGRWRLRDPSDFSKMWTEQEKKEKGMSYIVGEVNGKKTIQAIRFEKEVWTEEKAAKWWKEHKDNYTKTWTEKDWDEWRSWMDKKVKTKMKKIKIDRISGMKISRELAEILGLEYVAPNKITIDYEWQKDCLLPVGSIRRGNKEIGDIDVIITCPLKKETLTLLNINNVRDITGGEKRIDFKYLTKENYVTVNIFVFLDPETWGAALIHSTGPKNYNIALRNKLLSNKWISENDGGWKLSQNGLMEGNKIIPTKTERDLQLYINVTQRKPSER